MNQTQTITHTYKLHALPVVVVENIDWPKVYQRLVKGEEPVYACTVPQARVFNAWAQRHKKCAVYYRTESEGHLRFSLKPQRANAVQMQGNKNAAGSVRRKVK